MDNQVVLMEAQPQEQVVAEDRVTVEILMDQGALEVEELEEYIVAQVL